MEFNINKIKENMLFYELQKLEVGLVYLFGSYAEDKAGKMSDIDIGVLFKNPSIARGDTLKIYNKLYDIFSEIFKHHNIDLVLLERASLELRFDAIKYGKPIFEISSDFRYNFEEKTTMLYADFKPLLNNFDKAVLERIN